MLEIDFSYYKFGMSADDEHLNSPHYAPSAKRSKLFESFQYNHVPVIENEIYKLPKHIVMFANEVYPESAISDPMGDLLVWNSWKSGIRSFPYPGKYLPLEIVNQESKIQSSSTVGVIGECFAGIFATEGIGPWPIVRVIRKWPDFIFFDRITSRFALVESKAFSDIGGQKNGLTHRVQSQTFKELLVDALKHLVSDRSVSVWGAITRVTSINPFQAQVTFVECYLGNANRTSGAPITLNILGEFVMQLALGRVIEELRNDNVKFRKPKKADTVQVPEFVSEAIADVVSSFPKSMMTRISDEDRDAIVKAAKISFNDSKVIKSLNSDGVFDFGYNKTTTREFSEISVIGERTILGKILSSNEAIAIDRDWNRDWNGVTRLQDYVESKECRYGSLMLKSKKSSH